MHTEDPRDTIVTALLEFLERRSHEDSFDCACDVFSNPASRPCCVCKLRASLEGRLGPTAARWLATSPEQRKQIRRNETPSRALADSRHVYHVVIWTEGDNDIQFTLGLEGEIAKYEDAERLANANQERLNAGYARQAAPEKAFRSRVGILKMPTPDPQLKHAEPCTSEYIDKVIAELNELAEKRGRTKET